MTASRETDSLLKINRTVPVWSLVTALAIALVAAVRMDSQQSRQGELQKDQAVKTLEVSSKLDTLSSDLGKMNLKAVENEFRLGDLDRRVQAMERGSIASTIVQPTPRR